MEAIVTLGSKRTLSDGFFFLFFLVYLISAAVLQACARNTIALRYSFCP